MNKTVPTLPPNTTALERAIAVACAELVNVPVPLRDLWNADRCPVALLPFLAWACSVDRWDDTWPESIKRGTIKASYFIHKHKGTIAAVRRVVEALGYLIRITEWWQTTPPGVPGTFRLDVGVLDTGISFFAYATKVTHSLGANGFTTRVEFETKTEAVEAEREDEKDPDEGITGVVAKWRDVAAKKKKTGQEMTGATGTLKMLERVYKSKQAAKRAALHAWSHIEEVRDIIRENSEGKQKP